MKKTICNARRGGAKTSRFARVVALVRKVATSATLPAIHKVATSATLPAVLALAMTALGDGLPAGYTQLPYLKANANVQVKTGDRRDGGALVRA